MCTWFFRVYSFAASFYSVSLKCPLLRRYKVDADWAYQKLNKNNFCWIDVRCDDFLTLNSLLSVPAKELVINNLFAKIFSHN